LTKRSITKNHLTSSKDNPDKKWEDFYTKKVGENYPKWPNELMLSTLFGNYLKKPLHVGKSWRVLDVGCGFGNNLLPFLDEGCLCCGVEVTRRIAQLAERILTQRGYKAQIKQGKNTSLPFADDFFDLLLSVGVLHYEKNEDGIKAGLKEYCRVLKPGGALFLTTTGPKHVIYEKAEIVGPHLFRIKGWDFRNGEQFFYFDNEKYLEHYLKQFFNDVEIGRMKYMYPVLTTDILFAVCRDKK